MLTEAHGWEPRSTNGITTKTTYWKLKPRLGIRSHHKGTNFYLHYKTHDRKQLRVSQLANHSLQKWYGMEELLERSPTLPQTYQTIAGNDGKLPEKLTVNSTRVRRTEVDNRENISLSMGSGANTPAADFLALTKRTSPPLIQTTAYCTSLQELAVNRYHHVDALQNVTVSKSLSALC
ncbi:hypothetical protein F511_23816 [Dorcoceras hygrometricum]|uniref:Uncharacterized protein n=1 Tax=Dorcoceras hygrometricum TaxID=472368 RepID=A0A2Z7BSS7_9LAMI|nr:hypothetical protein F511_23816 [Dorcoceras hygrometricum]